jgi:hypothetical protein
MAIGSLALARCSGASQEPPPSYAVAFPMPEEILVDGSVLSLDGEPVTVHTVTIGELNLPSGRVATMDPFSDPRRESLTATVTPGSYPVILSLAQPEGWPVPLIAAAWLRFSEATPVTWHMALTPGQDPGALAEDEFYGFPVDAGSACLASAEAARIHARRMTVLGMVNLPYIMRLGREMEAHADEGMWAMVQVNRKRGLNAAFLTAGYGDGAYAAYWGYDADGAPAVLVIDFGVIQA